MSKSSKANIIIVVAAVLIVVLSVCVTLFFSGAISGFNPMSDNRGYRNITFTDAVLGCEKETKKEFRKRLNTMTIDDHSSRYEAKDFAYRIYLVVEAKGKESPQTSYYVNCFVSAGNGRIIAFEVLEQNESPKTEAIRKNDNNPFGFPGG